MFIYYARADLLYPRAQKRALLPFISIIFVLTRLCNYIITFLHLFRTDASTGVTTADTALPRQKVTTAYAIQALQATTVREEFARKLTTHSFYLSNPIGGQCV
jgi:hypothetical protein